MSAFKRFQRNDDGVTAIEYSLVAALIALVIIAAVNAVSAKVSALYVTIANAL